MVLKIFISLDCIAEVGREGSIQTLWGTICSTTEASATKATLNIMQHLLYAFYLRFSPDLSPRELSYPSKDNSRKVPTPRSKNVLIVPEEHTIVFINVRCHNFTLTDNPFSLVSGRDQVEFHNFWARGHVIWISPGYAIYVIWISLWALRPSNSLSELAVILGLGNSSLFSTRALNTLHFHRSSGFFTAKWGCRAMFLPLRLRMCQTFARLYRACEKRRRTFTIMAYL